jgi:polynucleotide 5'-hydroxyl-kinase GRC3/NOL9
MFYTSHLRLISRLHKKSKTTSDRYIYLVKGPSLVALRGNGSVLGKDVSNSCILLRAGKILPFEIDARSKINVGLDQLAEIWLTQRMLAGTVIWKKLIRTIFLQQRKKILLIGGTDKGKSTLAVHIINTAVKNGYKTAIIDADIGQGDLAPPNAIGAAIVTKQVTDLRDVDAQLFQFVGNTSPMGSEEIVIQSVINCMKQLSGCFDICIINTDGFVENSGIHYKIKLAKELVPSLIICLGDHSVFRLIKSNCTFIPVMYSRSPEGMIKSRMERIASRVDQYIRFVGTPYTNNKVVVLTFNKIMFVYRGTTLSGIFDDKVGFLYLGKGKDLRIESEKLAGMFVGLGSNERVIGFGVILKASSCGIFIQSSIDKVDKIFLSNSGLNVDSMSEFKIDY